MLDAERTEIRIVFVTGVDDDKESDVSAKACVARLSFHPKKCAGRAREEVGEEIAERVHKEQLDRLVILFPLCWFQTGEEICLVL